MKEEIKIDCGEREASYPDERSDRITAVCNCNPSHFLCRDRILSLCSENKGILFIDPPQI